MKSIFTGSFFLLFILLVLTPIHAEEGMYPLSEIDKLDLKEKGLKIDVSEIFSPHKTALVDAIVNLSGCTGSFISPEGLILTNHHCAVRSAQNASTEEIDYAARGFSAANRNDEIPASGYTVRITESYRDVSDEILSAVHDTMNLTEARKAINKQKKAIVVQTEQENPGKRAEVAEMFTGKTYVLFIYTYLKDVRLVYIPPRSIGNFGGDIDNWEWPRHNADFAIMRAYVAADGSPADYSEDNVPYKPEKYLRINPDGVGEEDFVFILGYPGRTYRHRSAAFLAFEEEVRMPFVQNWYAWQIQKLETMSASDPDLARIVSARTRGLSNTEKNYRGKMIGLERLNLVDRKREKEQALQAFINSDPKLKEKYSDVLEKIESIYSRRRESAEREYILSYLIRNVYLMRYANTIYKVASERQKEDLERESAYMDRNFERTKDYLKLSFKYYHKEADKTILKKLLLKAADLSEDQRIEPLDEIFELKGTCLNLDKIIDRAYEQTMLDDQAFVMSALDKDPEEIISIDDPVLKWRIALIAAYDSLEKISDSRSGALTKLSAKLIEMKKRFSKSDFIPDANGTFRLTLGHIRGYAPADAVYYSPITTLEGVVEKHTGNPPFDAPEKIIQRHRAKQFGRFKHKELNDVPVCLLYNTDTTGGNSGSPVLNAFGELIGLNFDRAFGATINDFAWSEDYSRSIGVDIRYILWILDQYAGTDYLLKEMGIEK